MSDEMMLMENEEYLTLRDVVFRTLRHKILLGEIRPGERLMEVKLTKMLGVSRTPIREAIKMLSMEGLVSVTPRKGAVVTEITAQDLQDVLEVRRALEELAVSLACERINARGIEALDASLNTFRAAIQDGDVTTIATIDEEFHKIIFAASENRRLIEMINHLSEQMYRYRVAYIQNPDTHGKLLEEHEAIYHYICERNVEAAKAAINSHIENQEVTVGEHIRSRDDKKENGNIE